MELLKKNYVKYGLITCLAIIFCLATMELTGQNSSFDNKSPFQFILMFIYPAVILYIGILAEKRLLKNKIAYKKALYEGIKISLVYALVSPFIIMLYYIFVNHGIIEYVRQAYNLNGQPDIIVVGADMIAQFFSAIVFGSFYAALIALLLRTRTTKKK
jgi:hypothetical protein